MDFSSPSMSSSGSPPNTEAIMEQLKTQLAQAYAQELFEELAALNFEQTSVFPWNDLIFYISFEIVNLTEGATQSKLVDTVGNKCFAKCVTKPSSSLSGSENSCISRCFDRYIEATGIVSRALFSTQR